MTSKSGNYIPAIQKVIFLSMREGACCQSPSTESLSTPYLTSLYRIWLQFHQSSTGGDRERVQNEWESMELNGYICLFRLIVVDKSQI